MTSSGILGQVRVAFVDASGCCMIFIALSYLIG